MLTLKELYSPLFTPELRPVFLAAVFVFGCCVGSFLNVCVWRMPRGESVIFAPSHCTSCGAKIRWFDNIPLVSYLALRGRCRSCKKRFTPRYFLMELAIGVLYLVFALLDGDRHALLPMQFTVTAVLAAAMLTDAEAGVIPDKLTGALFALSSLWLALFEGWSSLFTGWAVGAAFFVVLWLLALICGKLAGRRALGMGDVKLIAALAVALGLGGTLLTVAVAALAGALWGLGYSAAKRRHPKHVAVRFGVFIGACGIAFMLIIAAAPGVRWL